MVRKSVTLVVLAAVLTIAGPALLLMHVQSKDQRATADELQLLQSVRMVQHPKVLPNSSSGHLDFVAELPVVASAVCGTVRNPCVPAAARVRIPIASVASGFSDGVLNASILTHGDVNALLRLKQKLIRGEPVDVAVFGGSISRGHQLEMDAPEGTPGAVLRDEYTWGGQLVAWLNAEFPVRLAGKRHTIRNFAKPASGSKYAAEHYEQLLQPDPDAEVPPPDLVLCEFGVNDAGGCSQIHQPGCLRKANRELARCKCRPHAVYAEQLVRALKRDADTAVVYLEFSTGFTQGSVLKYDQTVAQHTRVCRHYGVPQWSLREAMLLLPNNHTQSTMGSFSLAAQSYWCVDAPLCHWYVRAIHSNTRMESLFCCRSVFSRN
jgi:lysophospholipase L1-like esterase